jgi:acyl-CoA reductase-like NAD-dependent aldehyde dehydrogenase
MNTFKIISPRNGIVLEEKPFASKQEIKSALSIAKKAQADWQAISLEQRSSYLQKWMDHLEGDVEVAAREITEQMGRPISQSPGELQGMRHRGDYLSKIAPSALAKINCDGDLSSGSPPFEVERYIEKNPLGIVLIIAPWNYPYLTVINSLVPSLLAGNVVLLKHAPQTALCGERLAQAARASGMPDGVLQHLMMMPEDISELIQKGNVDGVNFTGSQKVGEIIHTLASHHCIPTNLELGGVDAAYVRHDADIEFSVQKLVDGSFFNSGQSCCSIERIFVDKTVYQPFIESFKHHMSQLILDCPLKSKTTLGPVAHLHIKEKVEQHIKMALAQGAKQTCHHKAPNTEGFYVPPSFLTDVTPDMAIMREETFGPVVGIMKTDTDEQAIQYINDNACGLTASVWSNHEQGLPLLKQLNVGTAFLNQCDYLDPALAWIGAKQSGLGVSLSIQGFDAFTQLKSYYLRKSI